ncbi:MAG: hypothetical protein GTN78_24310 [Gemmatimonadales bacterium]|nr:hypothetical protein [Gemmatimonadales bacterium]NIN12051.1 hypothetical protein [Gemmatimonadales bacterium]NIR03286.1 hypothetical protein [Gemmatimonadales bacterium]NIS66966.1 hypothetical protein [Gemmatimonadales bacterium]
MAQAVYANMRLRHLRHPIMAAVVAAALAVPFTAPVACELASRAAQCHQCADAHSGQASTARGETGDHHDMSCCIVAPVALAADGSGDVSALSSHGEITLPPERFISGGLRPPPAPPPKA